LEQSHGTAKEQGHARSHESFHRFPSSGSHRSLHNVVLLARCGVYKLQPARPRQSKARPIFATLARDARPIRPAARSTVESRLGRCMSPPVLIGKLLQHQQGHDTAESGLKILRRGQNSWPPLTGHDIDRASETCGPERHRPAATGSRRATLEVGATSVDDSSAWAKKSGSNAGAGRGLRPHRLPGSPGNCQRAGPMGQLACSQGD
jgi:hypothetical protein